MVDLAQLPKETPPHFRDVVGHAVIVPIAQGQMILPSQVSPDAKERPPTRASGRSVRAGSPKKSLLELLGLGRRAQLAKP